MRYFPVLLLAILLSGCASTYKQTDLAMQTSRLENGKSVLIATPKNGAYGKYNYTKSGQMTALAVNAAFSKHTDKVEVASECSDLLCLQKKSQTSYYYVIPEILHWEDRATEWSGIPDKIEIKLTIFNARNNRKLASTIISGKSKWATFGGDHPQDLLPEPISKFVDSLY